MQEVTLTGELRSSLGTKSARDTRKQGRIPAVLYGGEDNNIHFSLHPNEVKHIVFTPHFKSASLNINGKTYRCIVKEVQFHPITDEIAHMDFLELSQGVKIKTQIPLVSVGEAPGAKEGGNLILKLRTITVKTTPQHLVDQLTVDVSNLKLGGTKRIKDIDVPDTIQILHSPNTPVASIEVPRILKTAGASARVADDELEEEEGVEQEGTEDTASE